MHLVLSTIWSTAVSGVSSLFFAQVVHSPHAGTPETSYLFIDGAYLRRRYMDCMRELLGVEGEIDFMRLKGGASKAFYYDCLDDIRRDKEGEADFRKRVEGQESFFNAINALRGYHVRLGTLTGSYKKVRQKQVDVLLAVEMLTHAFHKNMTQATLIAGDLDFKPIVDNLIQHGTFVTVLYDPSSAARELYWAADAGKEITLLDLYSWSTDRFRKRNPIPQEASPSQPPLGAQRIRDGHFEGQSISLYRSPDCHILLADTVRSLSRLTVTGKDPALLERYFAMRYGPIDWSS
jgi:uncharacterized LabA/DUF88 family protein